MSLIDKTKIDNETQKYINEFYRLKSDYEENHYLKRQKILNNKKINMREKRIEYKKIKQNCIICNSVGGTKFIVKKNSNGDRELKAYCNSENKEYCGLNIHLCLGYFQNINNVIEEYSKYLTEIKESIVSHKNKMFFGIIPSNSGLNEFKELKEEYLNIKSFLNETQDYLFSKIIKDNDYELLVDNKNKLFNIITELEINIKLFKTSNENVYINNNIMLYINKILPLINDISKIKYSESFIRFETSDKKYYLKQNKNTLNTLEINTSDKNVEVKKFNISVTKKKKKKYH